MHPGQGATRLARAGVFALVCLALSGGAHHLGGGHPPSPSSLLLAAGPVWLVAAALTSRRCGVVTLLAALGAVQAALHVFFHLTSLPAPVPAHLADRIGAMPHGVHRLDPIALSGSASAATAIDLASLAITPTMLATHLGATLVCAVFMAQAEEWLWSLLRRSAAWRLVHGTPVPMPCRPLWQVCQRHAPLGLGSRVIPGRILRGPPVAFAL